MSDAGFFSGLVIDSIEIKAPAEKVFAFMTNPENEKVYNPGFKDLLSVEGDGLGRIMRFTIESGGVIRELTGVITEWEPGVKAASKDTATDGSHTAETVILTPVPGGTRLTVAMNYCLFIAPRGPYKEIIEKTSAEEIGNMTRELSKDFMKKRLQNVKAAVEKK